MTGSPTPLEFASALLRYAAALLGVAADGPDDLRVEMNAPWDELSVGGFPLDSLDIVEVLIAAGVEMGVDLPGLVVESGSESVADLARVAVKRCRAKSLAAFCAAWP